MSVSRHELLLAHAEAGAAHPQAHLHIKVDASWDGLRLPATPQIRSPNLPTTDVYRTGPFA
eukprot:scaffold2252_cov150-Amphora_coffeaeformis.AAC.7